VDGGSLRNARDACHGDRPLGDDDNHQKISNSVSSLAIPKMCSLGHFIAQGESGWWVEGGGNNPRNILTSCHVGQKWHLIMLTRCALLLSLALSLVLWAFEEFWWHGDGAAAGGWSHFFFQKSVQTLKIQKITRKTKRPTIIKREQEKCSQMRDYLDCFMIPFIYIHSHPTASARREIKSP
jgi:hypothetical protein